MLTATPSAKLTWPPRSPAWRTSPGGWSYKVVLIKASGLPGCALPGPASSGLQWLCTSRPRFIIVSRPQTWMARVRGISTDSFPYLLASQRTSSNFLALNTVLDRSRIRALLSPGARKSNRSGHFFGKQILNLVPSTHTWYSEQLMKISDTSVSTVSTVGGGRGVRRGASTTGATVSSIFFVLQDSRCLLRSQSRRL